MKRAKVQTDTSKEDEVSNTRTSQTAWFSPDDYDWVDRINQRITDVTGLSADMQASHSELMQVANYGMCDFLISLQIFAIWTSIHRVPAC